MSVKVRPYRRAAGRWTSPSGCRTGRGGESGARRRSRRSPRPSAGARTGSGICCSTACPNPRRRCPHSKSSRPGSSTGTRERIGRSRAGSRPRIRSSSAHLIPLLGSKKLDAITTEDVQDLKRRLKDRAPKTVNNVLTVLNMLLKKAVEWNVIDRMPCTFGLLPIAETFGGLLRLRRLRAAGRGSEGARTANAYLVVLLGGEAGLRCGEMIGLEWSDVDLGKRQLCVQRSEWQGHVTAPKGGRLRYVPLTTRLATALREHRHLRSAAGAVSAQTAHR